MSGVIFELADPNDPVGDASPEQAVAKVLDASLFAGSARDYVIEEMVDEAKPSHTHADADEEESTLILYSATERDGGGLARFTLTGSDKAGWAVAAITQCS